MSRALMPLIVLAAALLLAAAASFAFKLCPLSGGYTPNWRASASAGIGGIVLVTSLQSEKNRSRHIGSRNGRHGVRGHVLSFSGITRLGPRSIGETQETTMLPDEQVGECAN